MSPIRPHRRKHILRHQSPIRRTFRRALAEESEGDPPTVYEAVLRDGLDEGEPYRQYYKNILPETERIVPPGLEDIQDPRPAPLKLTDLECIRTLGNGKAGKVLLVRTIRDTGPLDKAGCVFAFKTLKRKLLRHADKFSPKLKDIERTTLARLPWSPWVNGLVRTFHDRKNLYLMLEYMPGGSLRDLIKDGRLTATQSAFYFANMVCALQFLEDQDIVHRDLKPECFLIASDGYLCVSDFSHSIHEKPADGVKRWARGYRGPYMAPELFGAAGAYFGKTIDWWATGCILYEMLTQKPPFYAEEEERLSAKIQNGQYEWPRKMRVGKNLKALVTALLTVNAEDRLGRNGAKEVMDQPWLQSLDWQKIRHRIYQAPEVPTILPPTQAWQKLALPRQRECPGLKVIHPQPIYEHDDRYPGEWIPTFESDEDDL